MDIVKQGLIDEFFVSTDAENKKVENYIRRLKSYIKDYGYDSEVVHILLITEIDRVARKTNDIKKCMEMALPAFDLLKEPRCNDLSLVEVDVLARIIEHAPTFEVIKLCEKTVEDYLTNKYKHERRVNGKRFILSSRILVRLISERYFLTTKAEFEVNKSEIFALFKKHMDFCNLVFSKNNLPLHEHFTRFHEGVFHKNAQLIDDCLTWLRTNERKTWYLVALLEFIDFFPHMEDELTPTQLDIINGYYMKKLREEKDISREEVGEHLGVSPDYVPYLESGKRSITKTHLFKLAHLFDVDMICFFGKK